jgi:hypothetical protein
MNTPAAPNTLASIAPVAQPETPDQPSTTYNQAPAILLEGDPGGGKSFIIPELIKYDLDVFVIGTEPRFQESMIDACKHWNVDRRRLHTKYIPPVKTSLASFISTAQKMNQLSFEGLTKLSGGMDKHLYTQFNEFMKAHENFVDDETGKSWGSYDSWGNDRALVWDSQSGINIMAYGYVVGAKPVPAPGEWGIAMKLIEDFCNLITSTIKGPFVVTGHVERETDEVTGGTKNMVGTLGKKLAPKYPRFFSEVILCRQSGGKYLWSTMTETYALKKRTLPLSDSITPSFGPIIEAWRKR